MRVSWPLLGGVWGFIVGFGGYKSLPHNADSFGTMIAQGFFISTAIIGLFAGMIIAMLVGGLTERVLRLLDMHISTAVCIATAVNGLVIWQLVGIVQHRYPGLRHPVNKSLTDKPIPKPQQYNPCAQSPPAENSKERANWDAECR
jgi:hypothetical protein